MEKWKHASRADCISGISAILATWAAHVHLNSKCNRNDLAVVSEHTICGLLNRMYGWNLRNANTPKYPNFPSVDLVDEIAGVAVQVTVDNSVKKVDHTLEKFREHKLDRTFDKLILVIISLDDPTETMKKREEGCFYGKRDIWNITYLTREIENVKSVEELREIAEYLDEELGYLSLTGSTDSSHKDVEDTTKPDDGKEEGAEGSEQTSGIDSDTGETDQREQKESRLRVLLRNLKNRKPKAPEKKNREKEKTEKNPPKKRKWLPVVLLAAVVLMLGLIPEEKLEQMPREFADYSVTINGQTLTVPTTLAKLEEMGWVSEDALTLRQSMAEPHSQYAETVTGERLWLGSMELTNGHGVLYVNMENPSNHTIPASECIVYQINLYHDFDSSYTGESVNTLEVPLGLVWKQSSHRDVRWPKGYEKDRIAGMRYIYRLSIDQEYTLSFHDSKGFLNGVSIKNRDEAAMAAMIGDAWDTQPPEYDGDALADWLGVRMVFTVLDLAHNYEFPVGATVAQYGELGYTIDKQPEYVVSMEHGDVYFRCDTLNRLQVQVCDPFHRALTPENCFICVLDSRDMDTESALSLAFSDGEKGATLTVGAQESVLRSELLQQGIQCETGDDGALIIYPNPNNRDITIKCWVSQETGKITRIRADICKALRDFMEQQVNQKTLDQKFAGIE